MRQNIAGIINKSIPTLFATNTVANARKVFSTTPLRELPVLRGKTFLGFVEREKLNRKSGDISSDLLIENEDSIPKLFEGTSVFHAASVFLKQSTDLLPVLKDSFVFIGCVERRIVYELILIFFGMEYTVEHFDIIVSNQPGTVSHVVTFLEKNNVALKLLVLNKDRDESRLVLSVGCLKEDSDHLKNVLMHGGYKTLNADAGIGHGVGAEEKRMKKKVEELLRYLEV